MSQEVQRYDPSKFKEDKPYLKSDSDGILSHLTLAYTFRTWNISSKGKNFKFDDLLRTPKEFLHADVLKRFNAYWDSRSTKN